MLSLCHSERPTDVYDDGWKYLLIYDMQAVICARRVWEGRPTEIELSQNIPGGIFPVRHSWGRREDSGLSIPQVLSQSQEVVISSIPEN